MYWIERAPLALIGLALFLALMAAHEIALQIARRLASQSFTSETLGYLVSSALALLGLLMAFTFGAAEERFMLRQSLVVTEANAIGTTYLRIQLLDPPSRDRLSGDLARYAEARLRFTAARSAEDVESNTRETAALQDAIWRELNTVVHTNPAPDLNLGLMITVNDMFDLAASARAARDARIPVAILRSLVFCSLIVAAIVGFAEARERRWTGALLGVLLLLSLAFCLILDLDRPVSGTVRINPAALQRALADIQRGEAAKRLATAKQSASPPIAQRP